MYGFLFGGPQTSAGQVASVAGSFFGVFLFCGSQSARQMNQGRNRKRWFSFGAAESITLRKKKHTPAQKKTRRATRATGQAIWQSFDRRQKMQVLIGSRKKIAHHTTAFC